MQREDDEDFNHEFIKYRESSNEGNADANVLFFEFNLTKPAYVRISFVHATDEYDAWALLRFNDTPMVFIDGENIVLFRETVDGQPVDDLLSLAALSDCEFLKENDVTPAPDSLDGSEHHNDSLDYFDHEYGGFTKLLTKESTILNYGKTGNKDKSADFNRDRVVDNFDYDIWIENYPTPTCAGRFDGDANGDGRVDLDDEAILVDQGGFWRPPPREDWDTTSSASTNDEEIGATDQITAAVDSTVKAAPQSSSRKTAMPMEMATASMKMT